MHATHPAPLVSMVDKARVVAALLRLMIVLLLIVVASILVQPLVKPASTFAVDDAAKRAGSPV
jgi:hypothetical protein